MSRDDVMLRGSADARKPGRQFVGSSVAQWTFVSVLLLLFGLSRTGGAIGAFLRSFSTFLFP
jgi:hypothetical protein